MNSQAIERHAFHSKCAMFWVQGGLGILDGVLRKVQKVWSKHKDHYVSLRH